jgi:hypothetical protein
VGLSSTLTSGWVVVSPRTCRPKPYADVCPDTHPSFTAPCVQLIMGVTSPAGVKKYIAAAFPRCATLLHLVVAEVHEPFEHRLVTAIYNRHCCHGLTLAC